MAVLCVVLQQGWGLATCACQQWPVAAFVCQPPFPLPPLPEQARLGTPLQHEPLHIYGPKELQSLVAFSIRCVLGVSELWHCAVGSRSVSRWWPCLAGLWQACSLGLVLPARPTSDC